MTTPPLDLAAAERELAEALKGYQYAGLRYCDRRPEYCTDSFKEQAVQFAITYELARRERERMKDG